MSSTTTQSVLITGCSAGFGRDAALQLARSGHTVHATMRGVHGKNAERARELRQTAAADSLALHVHELDVTSDASVETAVVAIGPVDVLINNAGLGYGGPVESFTAAQVTAQLDVNIVGPVRLVRAVLPAMRERGDGLIIQISSTAGRGAFPGFGVYHASKWGLEGLSEALRYELAPLGIDVVLVEPGPFATNFFDNLVAGDDTERAAAYPHVAEFGEGFKSTVIEAFENADAPTDPKLVVDLFEKLIATPKGQRPLRTIAGLDFGLQAINDAVEPIRKQTLESMHIAEWDGPR
ncbi:SDR family oxidoreductase [Planctomycetes bacterium Pla163]